MKNFELRIKLLIPIFFILTALFFAFSSPVYAVCNPTGPNAPGDCPAGLSDLEAIVGNVVTAMVGLGLIAMLVFLIMAGFKYLTSGGEPKALQSAHHTLSWAVLGVLMMAVAWILLQLIHAFTGIDVTIFNAKSLCGVPPGFLFCK